MRDAKFFENDAKPPNGDCNIVSFIDFSEILLQQTVWLSHNHLESHLMSLSVCKDKRKWITLIISAVNFALLSLFCFPPSISPYNRSFLFARAIVGLEICIRLATWSLVCPAATKVSASSFTRRGTVSGMIQPTLRQSV